MDADKLEKVAEIASLQFSEAEIATICDLSDEDMASAPVERAIAKGRLQAEAEVRAAIKQMAKQGSTPAQKQYMQLIASRQAAGGTAAGSNSDLLSMLGAIEQKKK